MKAMYTFYAMEKGFVIERDKFEEFVKTQNFIDLKVEYRRLPINTWPDGTNPRFSHYPFLRSLHPHHHSIIKIPLNPSPFLLLHKYILPTPFQLHFPHLISPLLLLS